MPGTLYLVPNLLGAIEPERVLPAHTLEVARALRHWVVETPKAARKFLMTLDLPIPIAALDIHPLTDHPRAAALEALLAPALKGKDIGMLSDAGCPGVADPGAALVAAAHGAGVRVAPLVGPSSILLALMAAGMNGQDFAFHGYLPAKTEARATALLAVEQLSEVASQTQLFIETPYRNVAVLETAVRVLKPATLLCVAVDLTLPSEIVVRRRISQWHDVDLARFDKRPAMFVLLA